MAKDINDPASITAYISTLEPTLAKLVELVRQLILKTDAIIGEQIKWNSPSFFYMGEMKAFDPKEYKRDIVVFNLRKGNAMLVFPTGAIIQDSSGILEGDYKDGRRLITLKNIDDVKAKAKDLQAVIRNWLSMIDK